MPENGIVDSDIGATVELAKLTALMGALLAETRGEAVEVAVSDDSRQEMVLEHWPVTGLKRVLVRRTGNGSAALAVPTSGVLVCQPNEARLGMTWTNSGANPAILYLSDAARAGVPAVYLAASGGSWDGRFGNVTWCGNVYGVAQTGATTLVGGEF